MLAPKRKGGSYGRIVSSWCVTGLLVIVIAIAYVLVLRELQKINANLEQFIKLVLDLRRPDDPQEANEILHKGPSSFGGFPPR
jgi:hypothetical protein